MEKKVNKSSDYVTLGLAALFFATPLFITLYSISFRVNAKKAVATVTAIHVSLEALENSNESRKNYMRVLTFKNHEGVEVDFHSMGSSSSKEGDQIPVLYNKDDPHNCEVAKPLLDPWLFGICYLLSFLCLLGWLDERKKISQKTHLKINPHRSAAKNPEIQELERLEREERAADAKRK